MNVWQKGVKQPSSAEFTTLRSRPYRHRPAIGWTQMENLMIKVIKQLWHQITDFTSFLRINFLAVADLIGRVLYFTYLFNFYYNLLMEISKHSINVKEESLVQTLRYCDFFLCKSKNLVLRIDLINLNMYFKWFPKKSTMKISLCHLSYCL